jgi:hypothetical protein
MSQPTDHSAPLDELRRRRAELRQSMGLVEFTIAAPIREDPSRWLEAVTRAWQELEEDFADHIVVTEGPQGLYRDLQATAPRVSRRINRLMAEHQELREQFTEIRGVIDAGITDASGATHLRELATRLLATLAKHRQRGSDLVWEVYAFDVGGEN